MMISTVTLQFMSTIGRISVYGTTSSIYRVCLDEAAFLNQPESTPGSLIVQAQTQLLEYLGGKREVFEIPLDWESIRGFQKDVLQLTLSIPFGEVRTYGQLAILLHKPGAARAVGTALARNPMPILIPCHRVVASNGHLTGYLGSKGIATKQWLLEREGHRIVDQKLG